MRAISRLSFWKLKNALRTLLTDPRKLAPLIIVVLWLGLSLASVFVAGGRSANTPNIYSPVSDATVEGVLFLVLILLSLASIDAGLGDALLAFAMSDVDYLFPSPIARRLVLAYRLPAITLGAIFSGGFVIVFVRLLIRVVAPSVPDPHDPPGWVAVSALILCIGFYLNLAMALSVRFADRRRAHQALIFVMLLLSAIVGWVVWRQGELGFQMLMGSQWLQWAFYPAHLASQSLLFEYLHATDESAVWILLPMYLLSLIPMFAVDSNFYEQSIASTERVATFRSVAKGGYASMMAARAARTKYRSSRDYTVPPFGRGALALVWAHLCAAAKKPSANVLSPLAGGLILGSLSGIAGRQDQWLGLSILLGMAMYTSIGFMAAGRLASESAVRRRELIAPLPIPGWNAVLANLTVPWLIVGLFSLSASLGYLACGGPMSGIAAFGLLVFYLLRMCARMLLQYIVVLGYPDFADKVQQVLGSGVYFVLAVPLLFGEAVVCVPAFLLQSIWVGLILISLVQVPYFVLFLFLAGKANDKAIASGEPVNVFRLVANRA